MFHKDRGPSLLPLLPLRNLVLFPGQQVPLIVGREMSVAAIEEASRDERLLFLVAQRDARTPRPSAADLHEVGTVAAILNMLRLDDGTLKVLVEGRSRARLLRLDESGRALRAELEPVPSLVDDPVEIEARARAVKRAFEDYQKLSKSIPSKTVLAVTSTEDPERLADALASRMNLKIEDQQALLAEPSVGERLERLLRIIEAEIEILEVERKIKSRVRRQMERSQKEYYLNERMQAIQKELGEQDEFRSELEELERRAAEKKLSPEARERVAREIRKLKLMAPMSAEATVVRNYLDWVLALPWNEYSEDNRDLAFAERVLDEDHYGLRKVKDRILEYLAVSTLVETLKGPILCLVGPPGVGKTSLGRSIARATGRRFVRVALGGVRDEAEIRGHRRTYIGALPGKILQSLKRAGTSNPVFLLDEVDKMSMDFRGDPSAALLEVLDPEQNHAFNDHYLDLDYDLSHVMFVCTANTVDGIPPALKDRLEILRIAGYTEQEKLAIARRYLLPKQMEANGLRPENLSASREAVTRIIRQYTKEAGVRGLERELASVCRKVARRMVKEGPDYHLHLTSRNVPKVLGIPRYLTGSIEERDEVGLVKGLAVAPWGGEMLDIEVAVLPGEGKLILTGLLGDWLKESATAAWSYIRSRAAQLGLEPDFHKKHDFHVHYPGTGTRTDGPSAGIAMATALVSALTGIPVHRDLAMTGEITLRGRVLPIGGLKEKALAAHRGGARKLLVPAENQKDIPEIPRRVREELEIVTVSHMDEVLKLALVLEEPDRLFSRAEGELESRGQTDGAPMM